MARHSKIRALCQPHCRFEPARTRIGPRNPSVSDPFRNKKLRTKVQYRSLFETARHRFLDRGREIERVEFQSPSELARLPQKVVINATGYGARTLWKDESIIPVRGQIAWLIPQPEVNYGVIYKDIVILGRRDGIVVQAHALHEVDGYNDANESPDRNEAEAAVGVVAELYDRMSRSNRGTSAASLRPRARSV